MAFHSAIKKERPHRLSAVTRTFAQDSMQGIYGTAAMTVPCVDMDDVPGFSELPDIEKYDAIITRIAERAPIRICENELVSGAATLGDAIEHLVPANLGGENIFTSISHLTVGFGNALKYGLNPMYTQIDDAMQRNPEKISFYKSAKNTLDAMRIWHSRYLDALHVAGKTDLYDNLYSVPFAPAKTFREAVQSLWFCFAFTRLTGNWSGIGRIDEMLGGFLDYDLQHGIIDMDTAREILAHFMIKGCEWIRKDTEPGSGDAQHYQNIVLSGIDENGNDTTNAVTFLILDIVEELGISDFPIAMRINENTSAELYDKIANVIRHGGGIVAVYNESLIIDSMIKFGYSERDARRFANDGCWEVQIPGETYFRYCPIDSLQVLQTVLNLGDYNSYDELYSAFTIALTAEVEDNYHNVLAYYNNIGTPTQIWNWVTDVPCTAVSIFVDDCIEKGLSYLDGGARYTVVSPHIGGAPDTANSLYTIKKLVFEEHKLTLAALVEILRNNWENEELLRQYVLNSYSYYGNDNDEVDAIAASILSGFADASDALNGRCDILFYAGVSTFGRQISWAPTRQATAHGNKSGEILSGNMSPTPGSDVNGVTAIIKSHCKADLTRLTSGAALDINLYPTTVEGESGKAAIVSLIKGFVELGGFFMQVDVADAEILRLAQFEPEKYRNLAVRISGWSARFVTLDYEWQKMIIERNADNRM